MPINIENISKYKIYKFNISVFYVSQIENNLNGSTLRFYLKPSKNNQF